MGRGALGKWLGIAGVLLAAVALVWLRHGSVSPAPSPVAASGRVGPSAAPSIVTSAPPPPSPKTPAAAVMNAGADADSEVMPPPSLDQVVEAPARHIPTAEEHQATRRAARDLVESGIARLEDERRQAAQRGDVESAQRNQIRITRLRKRLAELAAEPQP